MFAVTQPPADWDDNGLVNSPYLPNLLLVNAKDPAECESIIKELFYQAINDAIKNINLTRAQIGKPLVNQEQKDDIRKLPDFTYIELTEKVYQIICDYDQCSTVRPYKRGE